MCTYAEYTVMQNLPKTEVLFVDSLFSFNFELIKITGHPFKLPL